MENTVKRPKSIKSAETAIIEIVDDGKTSKFFGDLVCGNLDEQTEKRLGELLLEGINSGPATPLTKSDFDEIRRTVIERVEARAKLKQRCDARGPFGL